MWNITFKKLVYTPLLKCDFSVYQKKTPTKSSRDGHARITPTYHSKYDLVPSKDKRQ